MAKRKYSKEIITDLKPGLTYPSFRPAVIPDATQMIWVDNEVVKGAFYTEAWWFWPKAPSDPGEGGFVPHSHPFDEVIAFFGTDFENPKKLHGEVVLWIGEEKNLITDSFIAFVPKGTKHLMYVRSAEKPMFHFTAGTGPKYA